MKKNLPIYTILIFSLTLSSQTIPPYVPTSGLVGWWPFNGNANDESGNGNNGTTLNGVTLGIDRFSNSNSAYSFDGVDDRILINNNFLDNGWNSFTISGWYYLSTLSNPNNANSSHPIFNTAPHNGMGFGMNWSNSGKYSFGIGDGTPATSWNRVFNPPLNQNVAVAMWTFVTFIKSSNTYYIYINGVLGDTWIASNSVQSYLYKLYFGGIDPVAGNECFQGKLDDVGIWNRALTQCEISQLYAASVATINATSSNNALCVGQAATLTASGASSYSWNPGGNVGNSIIISPTITTNYSVTGTNTLLGCTSSTNYIQQVNPNPIINTSTSTSTICVGQSATLNAVGASNYNWLPGGNGSSITISPTVTTSYSVVGTNSITGCSNTSTITQFVSKCLSILNNGISQIEIAIYPNPNLGQLYIDNLESNSVLVYNVLGQKINTTIKRVNEKTNEIIFDEASQGVYIIQIFDKQGNCVQTSKIIVGN